jgi:hypothetical protein
MGPVTHIMAKFRAGPQAVEWGISSLALPRRRPQPANPEIAHLDIRILTIKSRVSDSNSRAFRSTIKQQGCRGRKPRSGQQVDPVAFGIDWTNPFSEDAEDLYIYLRIPWQWTRSEALRGGMGMVYLAEQERPIARQVAVKIIKLGMDTRAVLARLFAAMGQPASPYYDGRTSNGPVAAEQLAATLGTRCSTLRGAAPLRESAT